MISIKTLSKTSIEEIHNAFKRAFSDYVEPFDLTLDQLQYMIERRGFNFELSFGAFAKGELVSFTLNGIGNWNGKLTAYDTGTGTVKEFRKQGLAKRIFNESLPILRENNISQYLLEVIRTNENAYDLYKKAGFKVLRELEYYNSKKENLKLNSSVLDEQFQIKEMPSIDFEFVKSFWDFQPSWQNSIDSILRKNEHFINVGAFKNDELIGYGIIEAATGDIPQMAINKNYRRIGLASALFQKLLDLSEGDSVKIINTEASYEPFKKFTEYLNFKPGFGQYEMMLEL